MFKVAPGNDVGLLHEIGRVLGQNAVAERELFQRVHRLPRLTVEPNLPRERAGFASGPQLLHVARIVILAISECRTEFLLPTAAPAPDRDGLLPAPCSPVPAEHHHLIAGEEVRQPAGLNIIQLDAGGSGYGDVGEDGTRDLGGERGHGALDVLTGPDVFRRTPGPFSESVQQIGIDVVADPKREDAERAAPLLGALDDMLGIGVARARLSVSEEDDDAERLFSRRLGKRLRECAGDIRSTFCLETLDPRGCIAPTLGTHRGPTLRVTAHTARERDQPEAIAFAQGTEELC